MKVRVCSPRVRYLPDCIEARYSYDTVEVINSEPATPSTTSSNSKTNNHEEQEITVSPISRQFLIRTDTRVAKTGLMIVGLGGNNGSTLLAGMLANRHGISWRTKDGSKSPSWVGSLCMCSTTKLATNPYTGEEVFVPLNHLMPMLNPNDDIEIGGWDISGVSMAEAMTRAKVLDYDLQRQVMPLMEAVDVRGGVGLSDGGNKEGGEGGGDGGAGGGGKECADSRRVLNSSSIPLPGVYIPNYIAENQRQRADNVLQGNALQLLNRVREDIRMFKQHKGVDSVIVMWSATTERFVEEEEGVNDSVESLLKSIVNNHKEIAPSTLYAVAAILEGCSYINGSPQNTILPCIAELADCYRVFVGGSDFKSGQTKLKSVMMDFLVSAGIRPRSIVSYNHLGNNDGLNLSSPLQFRYTQMSKVSVDSVSICDVACFVSTDVTVVAVGCFDCSFLSCSSSSGFIYSSSCVMFVWLPQLHLLCGSSKEVSKANVVDDMVYSNPILYPRPVSSSRPDHTVVIKYVPAVGDSKRAMDEYNSEIFLGGQSTIAIHNVCEDSLLAAPLMLDLVILTELCQRIRIRQEPLVEEKGGGVEAAGVSTVGEEEKRREIRELVWRIIEGRRKDLELPTIANVRSEEEIPKLHSVLSLLGYLCKAPLVPAGTPVVNALFSQREAIVNLLRACLALPPNNHMLLEYKVHPSAFLKSSSSDYLQKTKSSLLML
eukprot:GHVS01091714.1.p1 GENE.GHVS01091714.1~~GHVS01091714.1.p1  ORF type:complete len:767 (+),score=149.17 GHVS01091714.1:162-2303(+)